jgi:hypothetical protein
LSRHQKLEKAAKREIRPAQQVLPRGSNGTEQDLRLCQGMSCGKEELEW